MKKISSAFLCTLFGLLLLNSCNPKDEIHQTSFYPMNPNGKIWFADQDLDSIILTSYDPWRVSSQESWMTVTPNSGVFKAGTSPNTLLKLHFSANTSDSVRRNRILVDAYDRIGYSVTQLPYLDIRRPLPRRVANHPNKIEFTDSLDAGATKLALVFNVYKNAGKLTCDADWVTLPQDTVNAGFHEMAVTCTPNNSHQSRTANFTLVSNGVTGKMTYIQKGVK